MANLKTIQDIRNVRDKIRGKIKTLDLKKYKDQTFGPENEYSYKGMIGGIDAILTDVSTLTQYENRFIKLSTYSGRSRLYKQLINVQNSINSPNNLHQHVDILKEELRNYNIRSFSENLIEFNKEIDEVRKLKLEVQESLRQINKDKIEIAEEQESANSSLKKINEKLSQIETLAKKTTSQSEELKNTNIELNDLKVNSQNLLNVIQSNVNESESNKKLIDSFAKNVEERNKKLIEIEQRTEENNSKLSEYEEERESLLDKAKQLISSAKQALNYKTAEGLSASFKSQYESAKKSGRLKAWIWGAAISLSLTLGVGIWIMNNIQEQWFMILGRVLLLPIPISGAIFCASQYNKQKNIIEDYAYKMTIAKAIVGFSEQLKKNGKDEDNNEYVEYIQKALGEIHKDPLRIRKHENLEKTPTSQFDQMLDMAKRIVDFSKTNTLQ